MLNKNNMTARRAPGGLIVTSPDFEDGGWMPDRCAGYGDDRSPAFHISGISPEGKTLAVTLDDLGHPIHLGFNHWTAWNIPPVSELPGGLPAGAVCESPLHIEQGIAYGRHVYRGPKPPFNWKHEYLFTFYLLDTSLELAPSSGREELLSAAERHIIGSGTITGIYQRRHGNQ